MLRELSSFRFAISGCAVALLLLAGAPRVGVKAQERGAEPGHAVATVFHGSDGATHTLASLHGHPAVINFWATWCGPCKEEMPRLQKLADAYGPKGVTFVAISLDAPETQGKIGTVVQKRGFRIPVWTGATEETLRDLQLGVLVPSTLILDEAEQPIGKIEGETREKDVASRLDWLLGGRTGKQPKLVQKNDW